MSTDVPPLFTGLCDDAAVFPPGNMPLAGAVPAHARHEASAYGSLVGPFVLAAKDLSQLVALMADREPGSFRLSLTAPLSELPAALAHLEQMGAVRLEALEVAVPDELVPAELVPALRRALADRQLSVFVELPLDARRPDIVEALSGTGFMANLRTGGVRADLYPAEKELARAIACLTVAGIPFKATAGLHHALRNTDRDTGFEQHGFLNLLSAGAAALDNGDETKLIGLLADRDATRVADRVRVLTPAVRDAFRSFGTCSVTDPVLDLTALGLLNQSRGRPSREDARRARRRTVRPAQPSLRRLLG
jgi:hypothetical protein